MEKQEEIMRPKFDMVLSILVHELRGCKIGNWTKPKRGYFISSVSMERCARAILEKVKQAGIVMTTAGSTYPYDSNIRIAPTYPTLDKLRQAVEIFTISFKEIFKN